MDCAAKEGASVLVKSGEALEKKDGRGQLPLAGVAPTAPLDCVGRSYACAGTVI
jgi:hypothetical protein